MNRWLLGLVAVVLALAGYLWAGPYMALHGIDQAVRARDGSALARHVDFPALRLSLKAQLSDHLLRHAGIDGRSSMLGTLARGAGGALADAGVDALITPAGMAALMQGDTLRKAAAGIPTGSDPAAPTAVRPQPQTRYGYESTTRFTVTRYPDQGRPIVLVLSRQGLRWKLTDIRLPPPTPD